MTTLIVYVYVHEKDKNIYYIKRFTLIFAEFERMYNNYNITVQIRIWYNFKQNFTENLNRFNEIILLQYFL